MPFQFGLLFSRITKYPSIPQRSFDNNIYGSYEDCMSGCAFEQRNEQGIKVEFSQTWYAQSSRQRYLELHF